MLLQAPSSDSGITEGSFTTREGKLYVGTMPEPFLHPLFLGGLGKLVILSLDNITMLFLKSQVTADCDSGINILNETDVRGKEKPNFTLKSYSISPTSFQCFNRYGTKVIQNPLDSKSSFLQFSE